MILADHLGEEALHVGLGETLAEQKGAAVAQALLASGRLAAPYVAAQGTVLGRSGRVFVDVDDAGDVWIGGVSTIVVDGDITI